MQGLQTAIASPSSEALSHRNARYWRVRVMYAMMSGYALFYFVRKNLSLAAKPILDEFHFSNLDWGILLGTSTVVYAISKFLSGIAADRFSAKFMMSIGLLGAATASIAFSFGHTLTFFLIVWAVNNVFQGMGMPPCSRLLTRWFAPKELGRAWGIWNASHQMGSAIIVVWAAHLILHWGWRAALWVPGCLALIGAFWLFERLVDSPKSVGVVIDPADERRVEDSHFLASFKDHVLKNPGVWLVSLANFFVYFVRIGIVDWGPKYLQEAKGFQIQDAALALSGFEIAGIFGAYAAGWISDHWGSTRRTVVSSLFMALLLVALIVLFQTPVSTMYMIDGLFWAAGFFLYGPQLLIAVAAAEFAGKTASSGAVGFTGLWGYLGASLCGIATGYLVDHHGWDTTVYSYSAASLAGLLLLLFARVKSTSKRAAS